MGKKFEWDLRAGVYRALVRGSSALQIAAEQDVARTSVTGWARLAGMELVMGGHGGVVKMPMDRCPAPGQPRSYRRLTLADRSFIQAALNGSTPMGVREIARELSVAASTISREIRAHAVPHWGSFRYDAELAHYRALAKRPRSRVAKLAEPELRQRVVSRLNLRFSPQQVAAELRLAFPDQAEMHVSHETIYQALYVQGRGGLRHELTVFKALRSGRTARIPRSKLPLRTQRPWLAGARLSDRPAEIADRAVPGHWEGDLVVGPENSAIVTLVERATRYALLGRLPGRRDSATVTDELQRMIVGLPAALTKTITWDQGSEMAGHAAFTVATGCQVYFCDPHSPWQRGSNENTNGLIRDFYPKGTNFNEVSDEDIARTQHLLNIRPRRTLAYRSPHARLSELINGVALAT